MMAVKSGKKRKSAGQEDFPAKRLRDIDDEFDNTLKAGKVKKILLRNFMCHDALEVELNPNVNFIVGRNGSGKSAILTAMTIGLGANAFVTNRGSSIKEFIKKGKHSATVEVTLHNRGPMAYKPQMFGDTVTVCRSISASASQYRIKNSKGEIVSRKKVDLERMLHAMNIQIDNPISVLNQDTSRTFLVSSRPNEKYELFMKATLLDVIGNNYTEAESTCKDEYKRMKEYNKILSETRKEVEQLKKNIKKAEEIENVRENIKNVEKELQWSTAITEEKQLEEKREALVRCESNLKESQKNECSVEAKVKEIDEKIRELEEKIKDADKETSNSSSAYTEARNEYTKNRDEYSTKSQEWLSAQSKIKRFEDDRNTIRVEIQRIENDNEGQRNKTSLVKQQLSDLEQKLDEVEAMLRTTQTDQMHLQADKMRLALEIQNAKIEVDSSNNRMGALKREIGAFKKQSDNALAVFGQSIPRLLRRIDEEFAKGTFHKKPRGPIGAYIKVKDSKWAPAVENCIGSNLLTGFCVDNSHDGKQLLSIIKEIFMNERAPQILCSKFYENMHDVRAHCVRSPTHSSLLEAIEVSDPVIANCLIDQGEVETVLLIPTSKEASEIMSNARRVPRNCKKAVTQQADIFYPDPHYRSYGGPKHGLRSKYLQVSTGDAIKGLEEEYKTMHESRAAAIETYTVVCNKQKRTNTELESINAKIAKLRAAQNQYSSKISDLRDQLGASERLDIQEFKKELLELEKKAAIEKEKEVHLREIVQKLKLKIETSEKEVKKHRELQQTLGNKVFQLRESIGHLRETKENIRMKAHHATRKLLALRQDLQNATAEFEAQQRVTEKAVAEATKLCTRIDTDKSPGELKRLLRELQGTVKEIERQFGTVDQWRKELKEKETKYGRNLSMASRIEKNYEGQLSRLKERKESFQNMKYTVGVNIQNSFSNVLAVRRKKGAVTIDHVRKVLELEVSDQNDQKRPTNDARSLSGGERSYSTVAFILALWECTGLPFYFLDEFDVFMDKINRRAIMDILLDHAKSHPESQFTFLTPLDTSHILAEDYVTIHRLAAPKRTSSGEAA